MRSTPDEIRERIGSEEAVRALAEAFVDDAFARPLGELLDPARLAAECVQGLRLLIASEPAHAEGLALGGRMRAWLRAQPRTLGHLVGPALEETALDLVSLPYAPNREILVFLLDREPMRQLLRELFSEALLSFARRFREPVASNPLARGLGGLGRMARERARNSTLGALASEVAERFTDEFERQFERRAAEFAEAAIGHLVGKLADLISDPARAEQQASLRRALLSGVFALQTAELAEEMERSGPAERSRLLRLGLGAWLASEGAEPTIRDALAAAIAPHAQRPLGEVLEAWGLREDYRALAVAGLERRLGPFLQGDAFRRWLEARLG